jgi:hypothetical protein
VVVALVPAASADEYAKFRSDVKSVNPAVSGLELKVVRGDEGLQLTNRTGKTVIVEGYDGEQYLRFDPDGTVEANQRSAATYINTDRYGLQEVPSNAVPGAKPVWKPIGSGGTHTWFDHRIHLTAKRPPARFTRQKKVTKIFNWKVPMSVGGKPVVAIGTLVWDPTASSGSDSGGFPVWLGILIALVSLGGAAFLLVRRGRRSPATAGKETPAGGKEPAKEAW